MTSTPATADPTARSLVGISCRRDIRADIKAVAQASGLSVDAFFRVALVRHLQNTNLNGQEVTAAAERVVADLSSRGVRVNFPHPATFTPRADG